MKMPMIAIVYLMIVCPIIMFSMFSMDSGKACIQYYGFAIDNEENIYVGKYYTIDVINENGKTLRKFNPNAGRSYDFTITKDNNIFINAYDYWYTMDLYGNIIEKTEITESNNENIPKISKNKFTSLNGTKYVMKDFFFRTNIYRLEGNNKIKIYEMPLFDYVLKILFFMIIISVFIVVPIVIKQSRLMNTKSNSKWISFFGNKKMDCADKGRI